MQQGAANLRRVIKQLEKSGLPSGIFISHETSGALRVGKRFKESGSETDFSFLFRIFSFEGNDVWWPIEYRSSKDLIFCENEFNGKILVNLVKQQSLIEMSDTWAKSLEAQGVAKSFNNALL